MSPTPTPPTTNAAARPERATPPRSAESATPSRVPQPKKGRNKIVTTVNLDPDVLAVLGDLQSRLDRNRSYLVNALVRDFERRASQDPQAVLSTFQPQLTTPTENTAPRKEPPANA